MEEYRPVPKKPRVEILTQQVVEKKTEFEPVVKERIEIRNGDAPGVPGTGICTVIRPMTGRFGDMKREMHIATRKLEALVPDTVTADMKLTITSVSETADEILHDTREFEPGNGDEKPEIVKQLKKSIASSMENARRMRAETYQAKRFRRSLSHVLHSS